MSAAYGNRRIEVTSLARAKLSRGEYAEVMNTCRDRGLRLNLMFSSRERTYVASIVVGSTEYVGRDAQPIEAFRKALALRYGPVIESVLTGPVQ